MKCGKCDYENPDDVKYCGMCGTLLKGDPSQKLYYTEAYTKDRLMEEIKNAKHVMILSVVVAILILIPASFIIIFTKPSVITGGIVFAFIGSAILFAIIGLYCAYKYEKLKKML